MASEWPWPTSWGDDGGPSPGDEQGTSCSAPPYTSLIADRPIPDVDHAPAVTATTTATATAAAAAAA
eukprot:CAMPEP_0119492012 /NCGR_PEP_ID=MMETSP1344-20130328/16704_1 /TAXON_ID=236787 /ORGANISM="Florenciella parvula, Strain CCMP2471" /LENGTH=66 /DNA_ID=CAMNT_0007527317 /DNA_START=39 /DNA_END=236 /DNA_ORIENTATION=-